MITSPHKKTLCLLTSLMLFPLSCKSVKKQEAAQIIQTTHTAQIKQITQTVQIAQNNLHKLAGLYIGHKRNQHVPEKFLQMEYVHGLSIGSYWKTLEPEDGKYNWSFLDKEISAAEKFGKKVNLRVFPGFFTPNWVFNKLDKSFTYIDDKKSHKKVYGTYGKKVKIPIPWDPVYQKYWFRFIQKLGERYQNRQSITIVNMMGPNRLSAEMVLTSWKHKSRDEQQWLQLGYTHAKIIDAWEKSIDQWATAFPDKILSLNLAGRMVFQVGEDEGAMETIIHHTAKKYPHRFVLQNNALTDKPTKNRPDFAVLKKFSDQVIATGFQTHTPKHIKDIKLALQSGFTYKAIFFEIFRKHLARNPDVMIWANKQIQQKLNPSN